MLTDKVLRATGIEWRAIARFSENTDTLYITVEWIGDGPFVMSDADKRSGYVLFRATALYGLVQASRQSLFFSRWGDLIERCCLTMSRNGYDECDIEGSALRRFVDSKAASC